MPVSVNLAVEGASDVSVLKRILSYVGLAVAGVYGRGGKSQLDKSIAAYNEAAKLRPWVVVRDLDRDAACAPDLVAELLPVPAEWMRFRVAVREIETWILADAGAVSRFLGIRRALVPAAPEILDDPKRALIDLASQSRWESIKADMVRVAGASISEGPAYVSRINEFVTNTWSPHVARHRSDSLRRCIQRLKTLNDFEE